MLEILVLIWFGKKLSQIAREKGRSGGWAAFGVCAWIGGEILGFMIGNGFAPEERLAAYVFALAGAGFGALISFVIVNALPAGREPMPYASHYPSAPPPGCPPYPGAGR